MKKERLSGYEKNLYLFYNEYIFNRDFQLHSRLMQRKWNLPIYTKYELGDDKSLLIKKFEDKYGLKAVFEFKNEVKNIVRVCNMGNHWMDCVAIKLLTGKTFVPPVTFSITAKKQKKTVSINLGPHTTRGDLESVWTKIEKIQQDIWPRIKRSKISKKSLDNTFLLMKYVKLMKPKLEKKSGRMH